MIAIYNLLRLLGLPGAKGGFQANRARLARATCYNSDWGVRLGITRIAIVEELHASGLTLRNRRPFWRNIPAQLMKAKAPAVGVAAWTAATEDEPHSAHIAIVWKPYDYDVILCANSQVHYKGIVPFWITYGPTQWATASLPASVYGSKLLGFWQVVTQD